MWRPLKTSPLGLSSYLAIDLDSNAFSRGNAGKTNELKPLSQLPAN